MRVNSITTILLLFVILIINSTKCVANSNVAILHIDSEQLNGGQIKLDGEWNFYWKQLKTTENAKQNDLNPPPINVEVPSYWTSYETDNQPLNRFGYGTYTRRISFDNSLAGKQLSLYVPSMISPFKLYINGELKAEVGTVSENTSGEQLQNRYVISQFTVSDTVDIGIQISNFHLYRSGLWKKCYLGTPQVIAKSKFIGNLFSFTASFVFVAFVLILVLYFTLFRERLGVLWLAFMLLGILVEDLGLPDSIISHLLNIPAGIMVPLKLSGINILLVAAGYCFNFYFRNAILEKANKWLLAESLIYIPVIWLIKTAWAEPTIYWIYVHAAVIFFLIFKSFFRHQRNSYINQILFIIAIVIVLFGAINDILIYEAKPYFFPNYILKYCFLAFFVNTFIMMINAAAQNYQIKLQLQKELETLNESLELQVRERTNELELEKEKVIEQNNTISRTNDLLEKDLELKHRIFSIIGHDLRGHTGLMVEIVELLKDPELPEESKNKLLEAMFDLPNMVHAIVENLLFWGRSQNKELQASPSTIDLTTRFDEIIAQFQILAAKKSIRLINHCAGNQSLWADSYHVSIILRNLVNNAIKFTNPGGTIEIISTAGNETSIRIEVRDTGIGMTEEKVKCLLSDHDQVSSDCGTHNEIGTGIGLQLCRQLVRLNNGLFGIESVLQQGSTFWFELPAAAQTTIKKQEDPVVLTASPDN